MKHVDVSPIGPTGIRIPGHLGIWHFGLKKKKHNEIPTCSPHGPFKSELPPLLLFIYLFIVIVSLTSNFIFPQSNRVAHFFPTCFPRDNLSIRQIGNVLLDQDAI